MATTRDKLLASAQRQIDKGNLTRAIKDYRKLLEVQPDDTRTKLRIGDLQARLGRKAVAIETYEEVAQEYTDQGFFLKAVAILKQILRLDTSRTDVQIRLADLYLKLNLLSDCMAQYRQVGERFRELGDTDRYVEVLRRMSEIDSEDVRTQITLAEHYAQNGKADRAAERFLHAAEGLRNQERWDEYVKVAERYLFHRQTDLPRIKELVQIYLERGDYKRALAKLQLAFKAQSNDSEALDMLARAFLGLDKSEKALRVLKELAEVYSLDGQDELALDTYRRVLDLEPYDLDARVHLGLSAPSQVPLMEAADEAEPEANSGLELEGSQPIRLSDLAHSEDPQDQWRRLKAASGLFSTPTGLFTCNSTVGESEIEEIGRLIVEIDGFEKLGLIERARTALKRIFELDPLNISAMERAVRIDLARGNIEGAVQRLMRMTRLCWKPDPVRAAGYLKEALSQAPDHPAAHAIRAELGLDGVDLETFMLESSDVEVIEVGDISGLGDSILPLESELGQSDYVYEVVDSMREESQSDVFIQVDEDADLDDEDFMELEPVDELESDDAGYITEPGPPVPIGASDSAIDVFEIEVSDADIASDLPPDDDLFLSPDEPEVEYGDTHVGPAPARPGATGPDQTQPIAALGPRDVPVRPGSPSEGLTPLPEGLPEDLIDELEEMSFFMKAEMRDEAQTLLFELTTQFPEHTVLIMERMSQLEALASVARD